MPDNFTTGRINNWRLGESHEFGVDNEFADLSTSVMALGDLNGDGRLDVAVTDGLANQPREASAIFRVEKRGYP